jgi:hypothetical protein
MVDGQRRVVQGEPVHHAGTEVLHEDVGAWDERQEARAVVRVPEIQRDVPLVAIEGEERSPVVTRQAQRIASHAA